MQSLSLSRELNIKYKLSDVKTGYRNHALNALAMMLECFNSFGLPSDGNRNI